MRISELSERSDVPVASIKYYLREGLLAPGEKTGATQSSYDDSHLARLRLIRAFLEVGGLSVTSARDVLAAIDDETMPFGVAVERAAAALPSVIAPTPPASPRSHHDVAEPGRGAQDLAALIADRGWLVHPANPGLALAARVIDDYAALGREDLLVLLGRYADAAEIVGRADLGAVADAAGREAGTATVVIGTVLGDALFAGLRRMVHESASHQIFPVPPDVAARYSHGSLNRPSAATSTIAATSADNAASICTPREEP